LISVKLGKDSTATALRAALIVLERGGIIAYPTETFYGLGAKFDLHESLRRLCTLKRRPRDKAMPVIIGKRELLPLIASEPWLRDLPASVELLMDRFWPGPLTLLLPAREGLSGYLTADTGMIGVRIPGESFALSLARRAGFPITATSANLSGLPPADDIETVKGYFVKGIDFVIEGGRTPGGLPSTIVDATGERITIVREGAIGKNELGIPVYNDSL